MSVLKWAGGKDYLADQIIQLFPPYIHYVEPFFGSGAVLFKKNSFNCSEVVNDLNEDLINFWQVLRDPLRFDSFKRAIEATPFSEQLWNEAIQKYTCETTKAIAFFIRCRQSMMGAMKSFAPLSKNRTRGGMNEQVSAWITSIEGLSRVHARLKRVVILNQHALSVIKSQDSSNTLFYLDPPYVPESRVSNGMYKHEMSYKDHEDLLKIICNIKGKFILSGYNNNLYNDVLKGCTRKEIKIPNQMSTKEEKEIKTEVLWMNYQPPINLLGV